MAQDDTSAVGPTLTKKTQNYACQICRAPREICERCQTSGVQVATAPTVQQGFIKPYYAGKAQNYACQICRAPRERCERCQTAGMAAAGLTARRGRPRAILPPGSN